MEHQFKPTAEVTMNICDTLDVIDQMTGDELKIELGSLETERAGVVKTSKASIASIDERIRLVKKLLALKGEGRMPRRKKEKAEVKEKPEVREAPKT